MNKSCRSLWNEALGCRSWDPLRAVAPGVTKGPLDALLGRPHFQEGMGGVREWDDLFNFRSGGGVTVCQCKVSFDQAAQAQSFHWLPAGCAGVLAVAAGPAGTVR